jgi:hypothetical protein
VVANSPTLVPLITPVLASNCQPLGKAPPSAWVTVRVSRSAGLMPWSGSVKRSGGIAIRKGWSSAKIVRLKPEATVGFSSGASLTLTTVTTVVP